MSKDLKADREGLLRAATLVKAALASNDFIPALRHICFDGEYAEAYNDTLAISVRCDTDLKCLVPGALFLQALNSFGGKEVVMQHGDDSSITMKSGRARVKLPTLPLKAFPLQWPKDAECSFNLEGDGLKAIERCLVSVNTDATQPAQMGITLDTDFNQHAIFYSTDNSSVSRAQCSMKVKLPGDVPIILPRVLCEQVLALSKAYPEHTCNVDVGEDWVDVVFVKGDSPAQDYDARIFSRMLVDLDPLNFPQIIQRHCGDVATLKKRTTTIPDGLDAALSRALMVLGNETRKRCTARVEDEVLDLHAHSDFGDSDDSLKIDHDNVGPVPMDAFYVSRGLKHATRIGINDTVTILVQGDDSAFVHMVAHVREMK